MGWAGFFLKTRPNYVSPMGRVIEVTTRPWVNPRAGLGRALGGSDAAYLGMEARDRLGKRYSQFWGLSQWSKVEEVVHNIVTSTSVPYLCPGNAKRKRANARGLG